MVMKYIRCLIDSKEWLERDNNVMYYQTKDSGTVGETKLGC